MSSDSSPEKKDEKVKSEDRPQIVERLAKFYDEFGKCDFDNLGDLYDEDITFSDPIHQVHGLDDLKKYLKHSMSNVEQCHFAFTEYMLNDKQLFISWQMRFVHPKVSAGREVVVPGVSHFKLKDDKVCEQEDFYDLGVMIYEQIPVLSYFVNKVKQRMVPDS
ncbi:nuclear transport factor 2 family protein [Pseudidiomarina sp.]|uniref:nuclear transport factor 2 family protein n=1 Tax=Pseudidiomarina sp. TaxID=2081707 RepID=UPI00299D36C0|nr:nuclear transport factor 2 family protein [Pseudidiomarina sp.]MDX1705545.1 nuclear transport factor 2 family protein [Pseudidiomarina sp.]